MNWELFYVWALPWVLNEFVLCGVKVPTVMDLRLEIRQWTQEVEKNLRGKAHTLT